MDSEKSIKEALDGWANAIRSADMETASVLDDLGRVVVEKTDELAGWANAGSLKDVVGSEYVVSLLPAVSKWAKAEQIVEFFRNLFLLLPLIWTWLNLWLAGEGYHNLASTGQLRPGDTFLSRWQDGFQGFWSLSNMALGDVVLLSIVLLLTIGLGLLASTCDHLTQVSVGKLNGLLAQAAVSIGKKASNLPVEMAENLQKGLDRLLSQVDEYRQRLDELAKKREKEFGDLTNFTRALHDGAGQVQQSVSALRLLQTEYFQAMNQVSGNLNRVATNSDKIAGAHVASAQRIDDAAKNALATQQLAQKSLVTLDQAQKQHEQALRRSEQLVQTTEKAQQELMGKLVDERAQSEKLIGNLANVSTTFDATLRQVNQTAEKLSAMSQDFAKISDRLASVRDSVGPGAQTIALSQAEISANVRAAAESLVRSVNMLQSAARELVGGARSANGKP